MELLGTQSQIPVTGADRLPGTANYFIGSDPTRWHTSILTFAKVRYTGVYPGVNLAYYGNQGLLEYDFVIAPHADLAPIRLHFSAAEKLILAAGGDLVISGKSTRSPSTSRSFINSLTVAGARSPAASRCFRATR